MWLGIGAPRCDDPLVTFRGVRSWPNWLVAQPAKSNMEHEGFEGWPTVAVALGGLRRWESERPMVALYLGSMPSEVFDRHGFKELLRA